MCVEIVMHLVMNVMENCLVTAFLVQMEHIYTKINVLVIALMDFVNFFYFILFN